MGDENQEHLDCASIRLAVSPSEYRRGLTLIEVTLVLALMVIIASFCWPAINRAFNIQRLKKSADIVRIQWCKSRIKAMSNDQIVLFRYEMGGSRFRIEQLIDVTAFENMSGDGSTSEQNATSNAASLGDLSTTSADGASDNADYSAYPSAGGVQSLPKGIVFRGCEIENDSRAMTAGADSTDNSAAAGWSAPIYFYPDGTSSNARLQICNDRNSAIELALRGMTGVVTVGEVVALGGAVP